MTQTDSGSGSRRGLVVGLLLSVVGIAFEATAVVTAMPKVAEDLGDLDWYSWAFTAFMIGQILAIVAAGLACDRIGPKSPLVLGFVVFAVGVVASGLSTSMPVLVAGRFVQGLGAGVLNLAVMVLIARVFDAKERAVLMTAMSMAWMLPAFVGPSIAAWLSTAFSWHWVFFSVLPVMAIGGALTLVPLARVVLAAPEQDEVETPPEQAGRRLWSAATVAAGAAALQLAGTQLADQLSSGRPVAWTSLLWLVAALVLLGLGLPALLPRGYRPAGDGLAATVNVRMLASGAFFAADFFLPLMLVRAEGFDLIVAGLVVTAGSVGWTTGAWLQSRPWLRLRRDSIAVLGTAATAVGITAIAVAAWFPGRLVWLQVTGWVIGGLGMGLHTASTSLVVMQLSPEVELGRNTSALQVGEALGNAVVAGLAGSLFALGGADLRFGFGTAFAAAAVCALLALASAIRIGPVTNHSLDNISTSR